MDDEYSRELDPIDLDIDVRTSIDERELDVEIQDPLDADDEHTFVPDEKLYGSIKVNHMFESIDATEKWYKTYSKKVGFGMKIRDTNTNKAGEVCRRVFACSKEGFTNGYYQKYKKDACDRTGERRHGETRCGCQARLHISKQNEGWIVTLFKENHNHVLLTPSKVIFHRKHRGVTLAKKALIQECTDANLTTKDQVRLLLNDCGGPSMMGCLSKDIYNHTAKRKAEFKGRDATSMISQYFLADSDCRNAYEHFRDVVVFDTTFKTNKYNYYLGPFFGVNNHRQTIVFGYGLLKEQSAESFIWLFSTFLEAMPCHKPPKVFLTDQDAAIAKAVATMFPNASHHYYFWHILQKFPEKMNLALNNHSYKEIVDLVMHSEDPEEFERNWTKKITLHGLMGNKWLADMYSIRDQWVPACVRRLFCAGMLASSRVESNHNIFKNWLDGKCLLIEVVSRIARVIADQRHKEALSIFQDINETPKIITEYDMEKDMRTKYTKINFLRFQNQFKECGKYMCTTLCKSDTTKVYVVQRLDKGFSVGRVHKLSYNIQEDYVSCSCKLFEFDGIPCRHMLCWMRKKFVWALPNKYILRRWTKDAKSNPTYQPAVNPHHAGQSFLSRRTSIRQEAMEVADVASLSEEHTLYFSRVLQETLANFKEMNVGDVFAQTSQFMNTLVDIQDPMPVRNLGPKKRLMSAKEKATKKPNLCSVCRKAGHNIKTCTNAGAQAQIFPMEEAYRPQMSLDSQCDENSPAFISISTNCDNKFHEQFWKDF